MHGLGPAIGAVAQPRHIPLKIISKKAGKTTAGHVRQPCRRHPGEGKPFLLGRGGKPVTDIR
jgi:hypothetical protein